MTPPPIATIWNLYTLCFIIGAHASLDLSTSRLPDAKIPRQIANWMLDDPDHVFQNKTGHLRSTHFTIPVQNTFKPLEPLAAKLYTFLHDRFVYALSHELSPSSAEGHFTQFLNYFEETIEDMEKQQKRDLVLGESQDSHGDAKVKTWLYTG
ncbi:hypothetical protein JB92DRAFT_3110419 [Gautieria morchelliformis]|nr:hypothetical protein JB92DRAFT_3110419 [Gautieria morchelliformis]